MPTVFVGLSGGVDSAVSAALLNKAGYRVIGAFIKIWRPEFINCPAESDRIDAMRVCAALDIPFREINLSEEYRREVIDTMIEGYARGITPNPDVLCNRAIKFGHFLTWALAEGADFVATGHYARREGESLLRGKDPNKDQSYFLWQLQRRDLSRVLFPVGDKHKTEVRALAKAFRLPVADKKDSQGLCFVGDISMRDFLSQYLTLKKGDVVDESGAVIGEHDGAALYTPGERHGFRVHANNGDSRPWYVIRVNTATNSIVVSPDRARAARSTVHLTDSNWLHIADRGSAQTRYREAPSPCSIAGDTVTFDSPHSAPPGQSLVAYVGDRLLGGGSILPE